jgi:hypothetical protein
MGDWKEDPNFVGIVPLEANLNQKAIERLGPPPGNAEILIRGGAGWVFGIELQEAKPHPAIEVLNSPRPSEEAVSVALVRELAWRWFHSRPPFSSIRKEEPGTLSKLAWKGARYAEVEQGFTTQALGLVPKRTALGFEPKAAAPATEDACTCACPKLGARCVASCQKCAEA